MIMPQEGTEGKITTEHLRKVLETFSGVGVK